MSHVDYLCPACHSRMGVGGGGLDPLDWVTCQNCRRPIRFHYLIKESRMSILKSGGEPRPPAPRFVGAAVSTSVSETQLRIVGVRNTPDSFTMIAVGSTWSTFDDTRQVFYGAANISGQTVAPELAVSGSPTVSEFQVYYIDPGPTQVDDVVINYPGNVPESKCAVVLTIQRVPDLVTAGGSIIENVDPTQILSGTSFDETSTDDFGYMPIMSVCFHYTVGPVTDSRGTWGSGFTQGTRAGTNAATPELNATIDYAHKLAVNSDPPTVSKSGFTSREFAILTPNLKLL